jgi:hypothetical protein
VAARAPADARTPPSPRRPLRAAPDTALRAALEAAVAHGDGLHGAECIHELWMRGEIGLNLERALERLWRSAAASIPDWLPMRHVDWLPRVYEIAARCRSDSRGRSNLYLVLLDYPDSVRGPYGLYVGMSSYSAAARFDQHKAGIRAAGSVLKRGLEVLTGPVAHLQRLARGEAERIEGELAEALRADGLIVQGGH